ncbi:MAG: hypothetical protein JSY10_23645 [Paenibacillus sp.]|nr:hypothetical protein [Paenibacillus sp.]
MSSPPPFFFFTKSTFFLLKISDPSIILKGPERIYFYVNQRPINYVKSELKEIVTLIRNRYREAIGLTENTSKKTPFIYIDIQLPPNEFDGIFYIYTILLI